MEIEEQEIERRMKNFREICRNAGIKLTFQRIEVFSVIAQTGNHPDAESVYQDVRKRIPTISLDTVYRTLWMLNDLGLVKTLGTSRERVHFDANLLQHHHFVCSKCGKMHDFHSDEFNNLKPPESVNEYGSAETAHVEIRGVCHECAAIRR